MRIPKRRAEMQKKYGDNSDHYLSASAIKQFETELVHLEKDIRSKIVEEVSRTAAMGDLSENAAYQEAKARLRRTDSRIFALREKLKFAVVAPSGTGPDGRIRIGSTVVLELNGLRKSYEITGSEETDPKRGRISHLSPMGSALLGRRIGDTATVNAHGKEIVYHIIEVR